MIQGLFARLPGLSALEKQRGDTREFIGDGTEYLKLPGLKKLEICRVGQTVVPQETEQEFPDNSRPFGQATVKNRVPMLSLIDDDGTPILLRSTQSNHGIWQEGVKIYITGEWEDAAVTADTTDAGAADAKGAESEKPAPEKKDAAKTPAK